MKNVKTINIEEIRNAVKENKLYMRSNGKYSLVDSSKGQVKCLNSKGEWIDIMMYK